jgi:putative ABC transport system permease protein
MLSSFHVAWYQLSHQRVKLAVAAAGVVVAVMLMLVQLGIRQGAIDNSVAVVRRINADLVVVSPRTKTIFQASTFPRRLLYRLPASPSVERVQEMYMAQAKFRNPWDRREFPITAYGLDPRNPMMDLPGFHEHYEMLQLPDRAVFDSLGRKTYGPVAEHIHTVGPLSTEVNYRKIELIDTIEVGISINTDGNIYMSPANFLRLFPDRPPGAIDIGLVRLKREVDPEAACEELRPLLGSEARIFTQQQLLQAEVDYLRQAHPLDFIFGMGAAVGFFIGFVVVYQILYTEVTNHLPHFATMKAMGFSDGFLMRVVLSQALMLSLLGFFPGFLLALAVYAIAENAIQMPFVMTWRRAIGVLLLTLIMCGMSGLIAVRKARTADPADVF